MPNPGRIELHLRIRLKPGRRGDLFAFLDEAIPFYKQPGGIDVRLLEDTTDDHRFIELVHYDDDATYQRDQLRVEHDPEMKQFLDRWRALLAEPPKVEVYRSTLP